jgi:hypothetical protein
LHRYTEKKDDALYGDLADRMAKLDAKYDRGLESTLQKWIESTTYVMRSFWSFARLGGFVLTTSLVWPSRGDKIGPDFQAGLKSGVILCKLMNTLRPGSCAPPNASSMAFKQVACLRCFPAPKGRSLFLIASPCRWRTSAPSSSRPGLSGSRATIFSRRWRSSKGPIWARSVGAGQSPFILLSINGSSTGYCRCCSPCPRSSASLASEARAERESRGGLPARCFIVFYVQPRNDFE